jgi:hypothetical protein
LPGAAADPDGVQPAFESCWRQAPRESLRFRGLSTYSVL